MNDKPRKCFLIMDAQKNVCPVYIDDHEFLDEVVANDIIRHKTKEQLNNTISYYLKEGRLPDEVNTEPVF